MDENSDLWTKLKSAFTVPNFKSSWSTLTKSQKLSLTSLVAIVIVMPLFLIAALTQTSIRPRASEPITPPDEGFGQALSLKGNGYVEIENGINLEPQKGFTVEAWIKPETAKSMSVFSKGGYPTEEFSLSIAITPESGNLYQFLAQFTVQHTGVDCIGQVVSKNVSLSQAETFKWHHLAAVIQDNGVIDLFVDGEKANSPLTNFGDACPRQVPAHVGAVVLYPGQPQVQFEGEIDEVRVSTVARYLNNFSPSLSPFLNDEYTELLYRLNSNLINSGVGNYNGMAHGRIKYVPSTIVNIPPTPTSTPTPQPGRNNPPSITTTSLPAGQVGAAYEVQVAGMDPDANEALTITATGLPPGLSIGFCAVSSGQPTTISCTLSGTPTAPGSFRSAFTIKDAQGAQKTKSLTITIQ